MSTPHRATTEELRARLEALENKYETMLLAALEWGKDVDKLMRWSDQHLQRIMALEADATCPHIVTSNEGTSYRRLLEQPAAAPPEPAPAGSLVSRVALAISGIEYGAGDVFNWAPEARAAIHEVAAWLREQHGWEYGAGALEQEAQQ